MDDELVFAPAPPAPRSEPFMTLSFVLHAWFLLVAALDSPPLETTHSVVDAESPRRALHAYLVALAAPEPAEERARTPAESMPDDREPSMSRCGERGGTMGAPDGAHTKLRYGVEGPVDTPDPHLARAPAMFEQRFVFYGPGKVGPGGWGGALDAPTMPWGRDDSLGTDPVSARGHLWGDQLGVSFGSPGAGVGRSVLCDHCGDHGNGAFAGRTMPGGPTGTEPSYAFR